MTNLCESISDDTVLDLFRSRNFTVTDFFRKGPVSAMVSVENVATAVEALCTIHALQIGERFVKVSFSKFSPGPAPERPAVAAVVAAAAEDVAESNAMPDPAQEQPVQQEQEQRQD